MSFKSFTLSLIFLFSLVGLSSGAASISGFNPTYACPGTTVSIFGSGFGAVQGAAVILFNNIPASSISLWSDTQIDAVLPPGGGGKISVVLVNQQHVLTAEATTFGNMASAFDADVGSRWESAFSDPQWIAASLGSLKTVSKVVLDWENASSSRWEIQIQTNSTIDTNFSAWTVVGKFSNFISANHKLTTNLFPPVQARFIRMYGYTRNLNYGHSLYDFRAYEYDADHSDSDLSSPVAMIRDFSPKSDYAGNPLTISGTGFGALQGTGSVMLGAKTPSVVSWNNTNIVVTIPAGANGPVIVQNDCGFVSTTAPGFVNTNYPVVASAASSAGDGAAVFDANHDSVWQSGTVDPEWLLADLGAKKVVNRMIFEWENAAAGKYGILVTTNSADTNGAVWTTVHTYSNNFNFQNHKFVTNFFNSAFTRYVRVSITNRNTAWGSALFYAAIGHYWGTNFVTRPSAASNGALAVSLIAPASNSWSLASGNNFSWNTTTGPAPIQDYVFEISTNPLFTVSQVLYVHGTATNINLADDHWYWRVRGRDNLLNEGTNSPVWSLKVDASAPSVSARLPAAGTTIRYTTIRFSYLLSDAGSSVMSNWLELDSTGDSVADMSHNHSGVVSITQTLALSQGTYQWRVRALDANRNQLVSTWYPVTVNTNVQDLTVKIRGFSPSKVCVGDTVTVTGTNFGAVQGASVLMFGSVPAVTVLSWNDTQIQALFPAGGTGAVSVSKQAPLQVPFTTAWATSTNGVGGNPLFAIDNNDGSRWESLAADPQSLTCDFGKLTNFNRITINWESSYSANMELRVSADGSVWKTIYTGLNPVGKPNNWKQTIMLPPTEARYVMMYGVDRVIPYGHSIFELKAFQADDYTTSSNITIFKPKIADFNPKTAFSGTTLSITGQDFGPIQGTGSVSVGGKNATILSWSDGLITVEIPARSTGEVTMTDRGGSVATTSGDFVIVDHPTVIASASAGGAGAGSDGNVASRWETAAVDGDPQWLALNLGAPRNINRVVINWETASARVWDIQVQTNLLAMDTNYSAWTTVSHASNDLSMQNRITTNAFPVQNVKFVRMYAYSRTTLYGYSIWEMTARYAESGLFTALLPPPTAPINLVPAQSAIFSVPNVDLQWHPTMAVGGTNLDHFVVQVSTSPTMAAPNNIVVFGTNTNLSALADGLWYWRVKAVDILGNVGTNSPIRSFRIDTTPPTVSLLSPASNTKLYQMSQDLVWYPADLGSGIMSNWVSVDTNCDSVADQRIPLAGTVQNLTFANFRNSTNRWQVETKDFAGWSAFSGWRSIVIDTNFNVLLGNLTADDGIHKDTEKVLNTAASLLFKVDLTEITPITSMTMFYAYGKIPSLGTNDGKIVFQRSGAVWRGKMESSRFAGKTGELQALLMLNGRMFGKNLAPIPWVFNLVGVTAQADAKGVTLYNNMIARDEGKSVFFGTELKERANVTVAVHDITGRLLRTLVSEERNPGVYLDQWDLTDADGERVAPGLYIVLVKKGNETVSKKVLVK